MFSFRDCQRSKNLQNAVNEVCEELKKFYSDLNVTLNERKKCNEIFDDIERKINQLEKISSLDDCHTLQHNYSDSDYADVEEVHSEKIYEQKFTFIINSQYSQK